MQVEPSPILTLVQQENQSHHKDTLYDRNLDSNLSTEEIYNIFSLKSTAYLSTNWYVDFPLNQQIQIIKGIVYKTAPKHIFDELVKLNGVEFKSKLLFIETANVKGEVTNPNKKSFASFNLFEPLKFISNSPDLGNIKQY